MSLRAKVPYLQLAVCVIKCPNKHRRSGGAPACGIDSTKTQRVPFSFATEDVALNIENQAIRGIICTIGQAELNLWQSSSAKEHMPSRMTALEKWLNASDARRPVSVIPLAKEGQASCQPRACFASMERQSLRGVARSRARRRRDEFQSECRPWRVPGLVTERTGIAENRHQRQPPQTE